MLMGLGRLPGSRGTRRSRPGRVRAAMCGLRLWRPVRPAHLPPAACRSMRLLGSANLRRMRCCMIAIAGSRPYGFYVATGTSATTISFVNVDAHLNYDGFRFDSYGAGSQITLTGCRAFANRDVGIFDATTGTPAVTYNYTHLYANGIT